MKFSRQNICDFSNTLLRFLNANNVNTQADLQRLVDSKIAYPAQDDDYIWSELKDSNAGTKAYAISYTSPSHGIPLELRINPSLHYSKVTLKMMERLDGYMPFSLGCVDCFGNIRQDRHFQSEDISIVKAELERLGKYFSIL